MSLLTKKQISALLIIALFNSFLLVTTLNTKKAQAISEDIGSFYGVDAESEALGLEEELGPEAEGGGFGLGKLLGYGIKFINNPGGALMEVGTDLGNWLEGVKGIGDAAKALNIDLGGAIGSAFEQIGEEIRRNIINRLVNQTINSIQTKGHPVKDWDQVWQDMGDTTIEGTSEVVFGTNFCNPAAEAGAKALFDVTPGLTRVPYFATDQALCSDKTRKKNFEDWWQDKKDLFNFENGWEDFVYLTEPQQNPYGSYLLTLEYQQNLSSQLQRKFEQQYSSGKGFLGDERLFKWHFIDECGDMVHFGKKGCGDPIRIEEWDCPIEKGCTKQDDNTCFCDPEETEGISVDYSFKTLSHTKIINAYLKKAPDCFEDNECKLVIDRKETVTPGSYFGDLAAKAAYSNIEEIQREDTNYLRKYIKRIADALLNRVARWGLSYLPTGEDKGAEGELSMPEYDITTQEEWLQSQTDKLEGVGLSRQYEDVISTLEDEINNHSAILNRMDNLINVSPHVYQQEEIHQNQLVTWRALKLIKHCLQHSALIQKYQQCESSLYKDSAGRRIPTEEGMHEVINPCLVEEAGCSNKKCIDENDNPLFVFNNEFLVNFPNYNLDENVKDMTPESLINKLCSEQRDKNGEIPEDMEEPFWEDWDKFSERASSVITQMHIVSKIPSAKPTKTFDTETRQEAIETFYGKHSPQADIGLIVPEWKAGKLMAQAYDAEFLRSYGKAQKNNTDTIFVDACSLARDHLFKWPPKQIFKSPLTESRSPVETTTEGGLQPVSELTENLYSPVEYIENPKTYCLAQRKGKYETTTSVCKDSGWKFHTGKERKMGQKVTGGIRNVDIKEWQDKLNEMWLYFTATPESNLERVQNKLTTVRDKLKPSLKTLNEDYKALNKAYTGDIRLRDTDLKPVVNRLIVEDPKHKTDYEEYKEKINKFSLTTNAATRIGLKEVYQGIEQLTNQMIDINQQRIVKRKKSKEASPLLSLQYQALYEKYQEEKKEINALLQEATKDLNSQEETGIKKALKWFDPTFLESIRSQIYGEEQDGIYYYTHLTDDAGNEYACDSDLWGHKFTGSNDPEGIYDIYDSAVQQYLDESKVSWIYHPSSDKIQDFVDTHNFQ